MDKKIFETEFPNLENLSANDFESHEELFLKGLDELKFYCGMFNDEAVKLYNYVWSEKTINDFFIYLNFYSVLQVL